MKQKPDEGDRFVYIELLLFLIDKTNDDLEVVNSLHGPCGVLGHSHLTYLYGFD